MRGLKFPGSARILRACVPQPSTLEACAPSVFRAREDLWMEFAGQVVRKPLGTGSKSEREAVCLKTRSDEYVLRREGGNPFYDPELEKLVGKSIRCTGTVTGYTLLMSEWCLENEE